MYKIHKCNLVSIVITDTDSAERSSMIMKIEEDLCAICWDAAKYVWSSEQNWQHARFVPISHNCKDGLCAGFGSEFNITSHLHIF